MNANHNFEKAHPGCLGKMANLFEWNIGLSSNRLLTDRPHQDGSPLYRSRPRISKMSPSGDHIEDKEIVSEFNNCLSNRKPDGLPMNILIAQEMSKEVHSSNDAPNLVAKLMGLDAISRKEPASARQQRSLSRGYPQSCSDKPMSHCEQPHGLFDHGFPIECQEFCDILQQSQKLPHKGRCEEAINDKRMALVRQKFIEAKHLSMDKNLRQSKQFRDALEVLSSNKDLFLKCLQESNSMFYQHLHSERSVPPPPERKRITVLRPSKIPDGNSLTEGGNMDRKQMKKPSFCHNRLEKIHPGSCPPKSLNCYENSSQATHIIVLKPSPEMPYDIEAAVTQSEAQGILHSEDFLGDVEDGENKKSKEDVTFTQQKCEKLGRHRGDGTLKLSTFSSGYAGDASSSNKSEIEYADGNLSDSGATSPACRHSWDGGNRLEVPYSSTFHRASCSSKSSVSREAKRRLSERWATMVSHGSCQETKHTQRTSITLGDVLALSEAKKACTRQEGCSNQEMRDSNSLSVSQVRQDDNVDSSPRILSRSKSVPVSSTEFSANLNIGISVTDKGKSGATEEARTVVKSSFKGKLSSLFFSRSRKPCKEKYVVSAARNDHLLTGESCNDRAGNLGDERLDHVSTGMQESSSKSSSCSTFGNHAMASPETGPFVAEPMASKSPSKNQDQPSPVSVLDPPFEEDEHSTNVIPHYTEPDQLGVEAPDNSVRLNLIDKSPVIASIARSPSWFDDSRLDEASSHLTKEALTIQKTYNEEKEWYSFVKTLLCAAGFNGEAQSSLFLEKWHSPKSPLDPSLRDEHTNSKGEEILHDAKQTQKRTIQKLVFDSVNAVLVEIVEYASGLGPRTIPLSTSLDEVWARLKTMFTGEVRCTMDECGDDDDDDYNNSFMVETMVTKETAGKVWMDQLRLEINILGKEIGEELVEELVQEAVAELKVVS